MLAHTLLYYVCGILRMRQYYAIPNIDHVDIFRRRTMVCDFAGITKQQLYYKRLHIPEPNLVQLDYVIFHHSVWRIQIIYLNYYNRVSIIGTIKFPTL